jgi:hypothetical protein
VRHSPSPRRSRRVCQPLQASPDVVLCVEIAICADATATATVLRVVTGYSSTLHCLCYAIFSEQPHLARCRTECAATATAEQTVCGLVYSHTSKPLLDFGWHIDHVHCQMCCRRGAHSPLCGPSKTPTGGASRLCPDIGDNARIRLASRRLPRSPSPQCLLWRVLSHEFASVSPVHRWTNNIARITFGGVSISCPTSDIENSAKQNLLTVLR